MSGGVRARQRAFARPLYNAVKWKWKLCVTSVLLMILRRALMNPPKDLLCLKTSVFIVITSSGGLSWGHFLQTIFLIRFPRITGL